MSIFKVEIFLESLYEAEQIHQELTRYESQLHSQGFGPWSRLRCEIKRARKNLETEADLKPAKSPAKR